MKHDQIRNESNRLNVEEKLQLVGEVWDAIACDNAQLPLNEAQKHELDQRYVVFKNEALNLEDCKAVHEELRNRYK